MYTPTVFIDFEGIGPRERSGEERGVGAKEWGKR